MIGGSTASLGPMEAIAFDATPLAGSSAFGGHSARGIGRYVNSVLRSLAVETPAWAQEHLLPVVTDRSDAPWWPFEMATTRRPGWRPQDTAWLAAPIADRLALRSRSVRAWHANDPAAPIGPGRGRSIVTVHDLLPLTDPRVMARIRAHRRPIYQLYLRRVQAADLIIAVSHATATRIEQLLGVPAARIRVVYPAVVAPPDSGGTFDAQPDLLFVGVPAPHKNPVKAIEALAEYRRRGHDARLHFVGPHPPRDRYRLTRAAASAGMSAHVLFHDRIGDDDLTALYRQAVLLALSDDEGLGLPPIEALLAGGRVVAGRAASYREALGTLVEFIDPAHPGNVADAIERAAEPAPETGLSDLALRFSPLSTASSLIAAYESIA